MGLIRITRSRYLPSSRKHHTYIPQKIKAKQVRLRPIRNQYRRGDDSKTYSNKIHLTVFVSNFVISKRLVVEV